MGTSLAFNFHYGERQNIRQAFLSVKEIQQLRQRIRESTWHGGFSDDSELKAVPTLHGGERGALSIKSYLWDHLCPCPCK